GDRRRQAGFGRPGPDRPLLQSASKKIVYGRAATLRDGRRPLECRAIGVEHESLHLARDAEDGRARWSAVAHVRDSVAVAILIVDDVPAQGIEGVLAIAAPHQHEVAGPY